MKLQSNMNIVIFTVAEYIIPKTIIMICTPQSLVITLYMTIIEAEYTFIMVLLAVQWLDFMTIALQMRPMKKMNGAIDLQY